MWDKECEWSNCVLHENGYLYLALNSSNGLLRLDEKTEKYEYLGHFPLADKNRKNMFIFMEKNNNYIYFIPKDFLFIAEYNPLNNECAYISLPNVKKYLENFGVLGYIPFMEENKLYLLERKYRIVICIDLYSKYVSQIGKADLSGDILSLHYCKINREIIVPNLEGNCLYFWNLDDMQIKKKVIAYQIWDVYNDNVHAWINIYNRPFILKYEITTGNVNQIKLPLENLESWKGEFIDLEEKILFFPELSDDFWVIQKSDNTVKHLSMNLKFSKRVFLYAYNDKLVFRIDFSESISKVIIFSIDDMKVKEDILKYFIQSQKWINIAFKTKLEACKLLPQKIYREDDKYILSGLFVLLEVSNRHEEETEITDTGKRILESVN